MDKMNKVNNILKIKKNFVFEKILKLDNSEKKIVLLGHKENMPQQRCIIVIEKNNLPSIDSNEQFHQIYNQLTSQQPYHNNDIFSRMTGNNDNTDINSLDICVIEPVTDKLILKYSDEKKVVIKESYAMYKQIWQPFLANPVKQQEETQWIQNIVDGKAEQEAILFRDQQCIIIPNFDFQKSQDIRHLHLLAFPVNNQLLSLRCLNQSHLPLLTNIYKKGIEMIKSVYNLDESQVKICLHYQPTYYWLHVHFVSSQHNSASFDCLRSHLLSMVIQNIEMKSTYYQSVELEYQLPYSHQLVKQLQKRQ